MSNDTNTCTTTSIIIKWEDRKGSSILIVPPAAKMLTVVRLKPPEFVVQCLTKEIRIIANTMAEAKAQAVVWFKQLLTSILEQL